MNRKHFIQNTGMALAGSLLTRSYSNDGSNTSGSGLKLSLSQWALHREIFGASKDDYNVWINLLHTDPDQLWQGPLHPLDFPAKARELGFDAVEYVNSTFYGHATDNTFLSELRSRTNAEGIQNVLLMVDEEGYLGHESAREEVGITVSYWTSEEAIRNWKAHAEHRIAQETGQSDWYQNYCVRVAKVERAYDFSKV